MNDTVTILGRVGGDPNRGETNTGIPVINFRVASPQRRYDAKTQGWVETGTNWYNVSAFRQLAEHAKASLRSGDGVIVTGRLKLREWENSNGKKGVSIDIEADAIGHDLRWGTSVFRNSTRPSSAQQSAGAGESRDHDDDRVGGEIADRGDLAEVNDDSEEAMALSGAAWAPAD